MAGFGKSITGKIRKTNEDSILVENTGLGFLSNLYVVADGMGGHLAGEVASGLAIKTMRESLLKGTDCEGGIHETLARAVQDANNSVYLSGVSNSDFYGMGTTLLATTVSDGMAYIVNVGDSRLYAINPDNDKIVQLTVDHSYVNELLLHGKITAEEAEHHPKKNIITRALGISPRVESDRFSYKMERGDMLLMCSDGLTNMLSDDDILKVCKSKREITEALEALLSDANEKGGTDNISVILYHENDENS